MWKSNNLFRDRAYWLAFHDWKPTAVPHFRLERSAKIVSALVGVRNCDLLDIGCGPAHLAKFLPANIHYYGIDLAIDAPASNLLEMDIVSNEIKFGTKTFDIVVMAGVFEYIGALQRKKMAEVEQILTNNGRFIATYLNFGHFERRDNSPYNNIQPVRAFKEDLEMFFRVDRWFPTSHHWKRVEPTRDVMKRIQLPLGRTLPIIGPKLAVSYFFICSRKNEG